MNIRESDRTVIALLLHLRQQPVVGWFAGETVDVRLGPCTRLGVLEDPNGAAPRDVKLHADSQKPAGGWMLALPYEAESPPLLGYAAAHILVPHDGTAPRTVGEATHPSTRLLREALATVTGYGQDAIKNVLETALATTVQMRWWYDDTAYLEKITAALHTLHAYPDRVLCLTNQVEVKINPAGALSRSFDPLAVYARVRHRAPSPHQGVICVEGEALVSASPELFLRVHSGEVISAPMKGTRPRGDTQREDDALRQELLASVKETRENTAVTNAYAEELRAVCQPGTVRVTERHRIETHPHVHQMVSEVRGSLNMGVQLGDLLDAVFPALSMIGTPRGWARTITGQLEGAPRGLYSGCYGWVGENGDVELAMSIRCAHLSGDTARIGVGGGLTTRSLPEEELAEIHVKARAMLEAVTGQAARPSKRVTSEHE